MIEIIFRHFLQIMEVIETIYLQGDYATSNRTRN